MKLFNDIELFNSAALGKKTFDMPNLKLMQYDGFVLKNKADRCYKTLLHNTFWREYQLPMDDKIVTAPPMVALYRSADEAGESDLF